MKTNGKQSRPLNGNEHKWRPIENTSNIENHEKHMKITKIHANERKTIKTSERQREPMEANRKYEQRVKLAKDT